MKTNNFKAIKIITFFLFIAFMQSSAQITWTQRNSFAGGARNVSYAFAIGNKGYVGSGIAYNGSAFNYINDFWEFDPAANVWTQKASFSVNKRSGASAFSYGNKGYVCMGYDGSGNYLNDLWAYDPIADSWTQKASCPCAGQYTCASFLIGNYFYVGSGKGANGYDMNFYKYDIVNDFWTIIASIPGPSRQSAMGFSVNGLGYVVCGGTDVAIYKTLWQYIPSMDLWLQKASYPGNGATNLASFVNNGQAYIGTGGTPSNPSPNTFKDFYGYNPNTDTWNYFSTFPGIERYASVSITIGNKDYMGLGSAGVFPNVNYQSDWWELSFLAGITDLHYDVNLSVFPNPSSSVVNFKNDFNDGNYIANIFDANGKLISISELENNKETAIDVASWTNGMYMYSIYSNKKIIKTGSITISH